MKKSKTEVQEVDFVFWEGPCRCQQKTCLCKEGPASNAGSRGARLISETTASWRVFKGKYNNHLKGYKKSLKEGNSGSLLSI